MDLLQTVHGTPAGTAAKESEFEDQIKCALKCLAELFVDLPTTIFTDRFVHTQCFPTDDFDNDKHLAGISNDGSLFPILN